MGEGCVCVEEGELISNGWGLFYFLLTFEEDPLGMQEYKVDAHLLMWQGQEVDLTSSMDEAQGPSFTVPYQLNASFHSLWQYIMINIRYLLLSIIFIWLQAVQFDLSLYESSNQSKKRRKTEPVSIIMSTHSQRLYNQNRLSMYVCTYMEFVSGYTLLLSHTYIYKWTEIFKKIGKKTLRTTK